MNRTLSLVLRVLGIDLSPPANRLGRYRRYSERTLLILGLGYLGLHAFPQALFAHHVTADGLTLYSRTPLPVSGATACLHRAASLVARSELAVPGRRERIFLCDSPWVFRLFGPFSGSAFAFSVPMTDDIFVAAADPGRDVARSPAASYNTRSFSGVIAHEITHGLIRQRLGLFRGATLPAWVAEGYCDFVAGEGSFPDAAGVRLLAAGRSDASQSFRYFMYRRTVTHLLVDEHLSFAQVVDRAGDAPGAQAETRRAILERHTSTP